MSTNASKPSLSGHRSDRYSGPQMDSGTVSVLFPYIFSGDLLFYLFGGLYSTRYTTHCLFMCSTRVLIICAFPERRSDRRCKALMGTRAADSFSRMMKALPTVSVPRAFIEGSARVRRDGSRQNVCIWAPLVQSYIYCF